MTLTYAFESTIRHIDITCNLCEDELFADSNRPKGAPTVQGFSAVASACKNHNVAF